MKANKRTVWVLTLMSLVAVISIYYIKGPMPFDGITIFGDKETIDSIALNEKPAGTGQQSPVFAESYLFQDLRMEVNNARSLLKEQLETKMKSADFTVAEKNEAYNEKIHLSKRDSAEALMEILIKDLGYPDAIVRTEKGKVLVSVLAEEKSAAQANEIIHIVMSNWDEAREVQVKFEGGK